MHTLALSCLLACLLAASEGNTREYTPPPPPPPRCARSRFLGLLRTLSLSLSLSLACLLGVWGKNPWPLGLPLKVARMKPWRSTTLICLSLSRVLREKAHLAYNEYTVP